MYVYSPIILLFLSTPPPPRPPAQFAATHVVGLCGLGSAFGHIVP